MPNHMIFNERPECQDRLISFLQKMGYEYVSRSEAEQKRGSLSKVIFTDELIRFLNKQSYKFKNFELNFFGRIRSARRQCAGCFFAAGSFHGKQRNIQPSDIRRQR